MSKWKLKYNFKEKSNKKWELEAFCDSDFAGDKEKRINLVKPQNATILK